MQTQNVLSFLTNPIISNIVLNSSKTTSVAVDPGARGLIPTVGTTIILTGTNLGELSNVVQGLVLSFFSS